MLTTLRETPLFAPYPDSQEVMLPQHEAAWYRGLYQYAAHLVNRAAIEDAAPYASPRHDLAARCARLLVWATGGAPQRQCEQTDRLQAFRKDVAALGLVVLSGELLVLAPPTPVDLSPLAATLLQFGRRELTAVQPPTGVDVTTPMHAGRAQEFVQAALGMPATATGRSRLRYNLACLAAQAAETSGLQGQHVRAGTIALLAAEDETDVSPNDAIPLVCAAWLLLDGAVLGTELAHWAWKDPSLAALRETDRTSFAAAVGPAPASEPHADRPQTSSTS